MKVVDDGDDRPFTGQALHHGPGGQRRLPDGAARVPHRVRVGGAQQQLEAAHQVAGPAWPGDAVGQPPHLAVGDGPRRVDGQADQVLDRAGDRGQRQPLPVGRAASAEEDGVGSAPGELGGQPCLAGPRLGRHHQEGGVPLMQLAASARASASSFVSRSTKPPETAGVARPAGRAERTSMASKATTGLGLPFAR